MGAEADAGVNETRAIPFAKELLRLELHFSSSPLMKGTTLPWISIAGTPG